MNRMPRMRMLCLLQLVPLLQYVTEVVRSFWRPGRPGRQVRNANAVWILMRRNEMEGRWLSLAPERAIHKTIDTAIRTMVWHVSK